jgi:signal transduction histidine kinase/ActR/RegA family two-component response regulator
MAVAAFPNQRRFMDWLFHSRRVGPTGADQRSAAAGNAERALRALLAASIILPILIFAGIATIAYQQHFRDGRTRLEATLGVIYEHALKVFETFELAARYTDELFDDVSDEQIIASEAEYHARLKTLTDNLPQLRDILVIDRNGRPLVSGTIFPMPHQTDLSGRDFFARHRQDPASGVLISGVIQSRVADRHVIVISRRRPDPSGRNEFRGTTTTAIAPEYFAEYYATLPFRPSTFAALVREDGAILARHPPLGTRPDQLMPQTPILSQLRISPQSGFLTAVSPFDTIERMIAYRRLPRHGVYVVAGVETRSIVAEWARAMLGHLVFGVPAAVAIVMLAWVALRHTQRESLAHARLNQEVAQRELTENALRQSQKMEAIGRLTGGIAHDFNNLLTAILGNVDLAVLRLGEADERVKRNLASAREASQRAVTLVNRLLAYSRQHPLEVSVVDINRLVQGMSELIRRAIGETISVQVVLAAGLWKTAVDANQLESAILNLAVNAKDAMPEGGRITVETANTYLDEAYLAAHGDGVAAGQYVMLALTDTGSGMSREVMEHAFEPFFTTKPSGVGTGLGLSMVYGFVKQSGGHIRIYSEVGAGTTVKLYFPRNRERRESLDTSEEDVPASPPLARQAPETVLVVEDDEEVARFTSEVLREAGHRVLAARDGTGALRLLERNPEVALLFTDMVLPGGMNGPELAREAQKRRPALRVVYATGYSRNAVLQDRLEPDMPLLTKPFTYEALASMVQQVLDRGHAPEQRQRPTGT